MNYIGDHSNDKLSNELKDITYDDIRRMYEKNLQDAEECDRLTDNTRHEAFDNHEDEAEIQTPSALRSKLYGDILVKDPKISGFIMSYGDSPIIRQGERGSYYRGETKIYAKSGTTLSRPLDKLSSDEDRLLYRLIADMRIAEFECFIHKFDRVKRWEEDERTTVLTEPLAQHYGLETDWLDITNDFTTALFFATCRWNDDTKRWYPLTKKEMEEGVDGDPDKTRHGILFHAPAWRVMAENMSLFSTNSDEGMICPIGYQPFMRCHSQYGYGMHMRRSIPLQENPAFEKLRFLHSEKMSQAVYELMDGGRKVYPKEGFDDFQDIIDSIKNATDFSEEAFLSALEKNGLSDRVEEYRSALEKSNIFSMSISICGDRHPFTLSRQRIRRANRKNEGFSIERDYDIKTITRPIFWPDGQN